MLFMSSKYHIIREVASLNFDWVDYQWIYYVIVRFNLYVFMDRRQITFITLNGFCPSPQCCKWTISSYTEYQSKINKKCTPVWHCISCFEGTSYEKLQDTATSCFICCCFISDFTSADITFNTFLELHSVLSEKRSSSQNFLFQQIYPNPPLP